MPDSILLWCISSGGFMTPSFLWHLFVSFLYLSSHLYQHGFMNSSFMQKFIIYYSLFILRFKLPQIWSLGVLLSCFLCLFDMSSSFFSISLLSGTVRCSSFTNFFFFPSPSLGIRHFFKELYFHLVGNGILKQDQYTTYTHCYWGALASGCQWRELEIHTYFLSICLLKTWSLC